MSFITHAAAKMLKMQHIFAYNGLPLAVAAPERQDSQVISR